MHRHLTAPFNEARKAFRARQFGKCDQILPGLESLIILSIGCSQAVIDDFVDWARRNRPCDAFIIEVTRD